MGRIGVPGAREPGGCRARPHRGGWMARPRPESARWASWTFVSCPGSVVPELGEVRKERQLDLPRRAVAVLGHDELGDVLGGLFGVVAVDEHDDVRGLLGGATCVAH